MRLEKTGEPKVTPCKFVERRQYIWHGFDSDRYFAPLVGITFNVYEINSKSDRGNKIPTESQRVTITSDGRDYEITIFKIAH